MLERLEKPERLERISMDIFLLRSSVVPMYIGTEGCRAGRSSVRRNEGLWITLAVVFLLWYFCSYLRQILDYLVVPLQSGIM